MNIRLNARPVCLIRTQALTLDDARGASIRCRRGRVWITQNGDPRDIVLVGGEGFTLDRDSPAIVTALCDSAVEVLPGEVSPALAGAFAQAWRRARAAFGTRAAGAFRTATAS